jgi:hypothetical protein
MTLEDRLKIYILILNSVRVDANVVLGLFSDALSTAVTYVALIT